MSKMMRLLLLIVLFASTANAQSYYFRRYEVENGLSNNTVFCALQDKKGFLWFGTKDGLNRFDGYLFKVFHININDERSMERDQISALALDSAGNIWAGSQKGIFRFDEEKEELVPMFDSLRDVHRLYIDSRGQLWFTTNQTIHCYNAASKKLTRYDESKYFPASTFIEQEGYMWFGSRNGYLYQLDPTTGKFKGFDLFANSKKPESYWIEKIASAKKGYIYIGTSAQGLKQFDIKNSTYKDVLTYNPDKTTVYVRDLLRTSEDEFWIATESGIFILNANDNSYVNLRKKYLDPYSISDNAVYNVYKDREGGIWAGTYFGGLNYTPKQLSSSFQKFFPDYTKNSISGNVVREICEDHEGNIWFGTEDDGLNKLNVKTGDITKFKPTGSPESIAYSNIHGVMVVGNDLWVGTFEHGLDILDIKTGKVKKHFIAGTGPNDLRSNFMVTFLQTRAGEIYVGTSNTVMRYIPEHDNFIKAEGFPDGGFISCLLEDHEGTIWAGLHSSGIHYYNPQTKERGQLLNQFDNKNSLTNNTVNAIFEDSFNNLWFATEGGGLCQYSKATKQFTRYTNKNGMPSNFVYKVLEDNRKTLWATTSKGLVSIDLVTNKKNVFTKANGLLNDQFNYNSGYKDSQGKLYFGSVRGMITFKPDSFYHTKFTPPIFITGFQVHNKELPISTDSSALKKSILLTDKIVLPYDQSSFSIDFAALSFTSPEMTEYQYIMEGLDKEWVNIKSNRKVYFTNLKAGTYTFKVKAASNEFSGNRETKLVVKILPPWWATVWAYLIYGVIIGSLLFYLVRTYHNMQENRKEKEIYEAKIDFFVNIAHEIKTPLTLIKGPVENLSEMVDQVPEIKEDVVTMERNTNRLVNLVNQIMDFRQTETKKFSLEFSNVNMNELLEEAYLTFEPVARKRKLSYSIELPDYAVHNMADAEALNKIFSNLFSNAVKYSDTRVEIEMFDPQKNDEYLVIEFRNDGYLIPDEMKEKIFEPFYRLKETIKQKGTGIGLALARSLVELHRGKLFLKDDASGLNVFVLMMPFQSKEKNQTRETGQQQLA